MPEHFKNRLTGEQLTKLGLNERQVKAVEYVKEKGKITNREYQTINSISERTASRELSDLVDLLINGILRISSKLLVSFNDTKNLLSEKTNASFSLSI